MIVTLLLSARAVVASLFKGEAKSIQYYDSNLTIDGLLEIWRLNK